MNYVFLLDFKQICDFTFPTKEGLWPPRGKEAVTVLDKQD